MEGEHGRDGNTLPDQCDVQARVRYMLESIWHSLRPEDNKLRTALAAGSTCFGAYLITRTHALANVHCILSHDLKKIDVFRAHGTQLERIRAAMTRHICN